MIPPFPAGARVVVTAAQVESLIGRFGTVVADDDLRDVQVRIDGALLVFRRGELAAARVGTS